MKRAVAILLAVFIALSIFVSCNGESIADDIFCRYVTYDANGGTGMMPIHRMIGSQGALHANIFTKEGGYEFYCWNTEADGSGDDYFDEECVFLDLNLKLYAQWVKTIYGTWSNGTDVITLNADGTGTWYAGDDQREITYDTFDGVIVYKKVYDYSLGSGYVYVSSDEEYMLITSTSLESLDQNELDAFLENNGTTDYDITEQDGLVCVSMTQEYKENHQRFDGIYVLEKETNELDYCQIWTGFDEERNFLWAEMVSQDSGFLGKLGDKTLGEKFFAYAYPDPETEEYELEVKETYAFTYNGFEDVFSAPGFGHGAFVRVEAE